VVRIHSPRPILSITYKLQNHPTSAERAIWVGSWVGWICWRKVRRSSQPEGHYAHG
jgi:hypothetical protein